MMIWFGCMLFAVALWQLWAMRKAFVAGPADGGLDEGYGVFFAVVLVVMALIAIHVA